MSTTGGFAVDAPHGRLAKRIERTRSDGSIAEEHWIEGLVGEVSLDAMCTNTRTVGELVVTFSSLPAFRELPQDGLGHWFEVNRDGKRGRLRITTIGDLTCMVSAEGPAAQLPPALAESITRSLRAAP